jgi:hypothetical protein
VGEGNYSEIVELKARSGSDRPLEAPHTGARCVWYRASVIREYEERVRVTDEKGRVRTEIRRGSETVSSLESSDPFRLEEGEARIEIRPERAEVIARPNLNRFEPGEEYRGAGSLAGEVLSGGGGRRTLGWRTVEEILPVGAALYVLGEATDRDGPLRVAFPRDGEKKFLISAKSEEELVREKGTSAKLMLVGGIAAIVCGVIALAAQFL